jgi:hypothetical protein
MVPWGFIQVLELLVGINFGISADRVLFRYSLAFLAGGDGSSGPAIRSELRSKEISPLACPGHTANDSQVALIELAWLLLGGSVVEMSASSMQRRMKVKISMRDDRDSQKLSRNDRNEKVNPSEIAYK